MQLSPHFAREEFEKDGPFPDACLPIVQTLCTSILEPLRAQYGPINITSGFRPPEVNNIVHGVPQSQHIYTPEQCAADCSFELPVGVSQRKVFDWARLESKLPIDQLILEHGETADIIHISYAAPPRQEALEGLTGNRSGYQRWRFEK